MDSKVLRYTRTKGPLTGGKVQGKNEWKILTVAVGMLFAMGVSRADLLSGCGTCQGSTYLLQYNPSSTTTSGADTVYDVFLTIDATNYTGGGQYINAVAVKIASDADVPPSAIVAAPGGAGKWTLQGGGLNAGGCDGAGSGFICAQDGTTAPVPGASSTYTWEFHYATTAALSLGPLASSIKVQYVDASGNKVGSLVSEGITLQTATAPEPTSVLLFGTLAAFMGFGMRKLRKTS